MVGGYAMVDCGGANLLADSSQTITGLYDQCKKAVDSGKPILAYNCNYGTGVPMTPIPVFAILESGNYIFTASILQITVTSADALTVASLIGG